MLRGQFIRGDGLIVPNNVTLYGAKKILTLAMTQVETSFFMALVDAQPDSGLQIEDLEEPTIGENGYARQSVERTSLVGWPTVGDLNGEAFIESKAFSFAAAGGAFDKEVRRIAFVESANALEGDVIALSAAFPSKILIDPDTPVEQRTFKYRLYLR